MGNNNLSNNIIRGLVIFGDFMVMNLIIFIATRWFMPGSGWDDHDRVMFILMNNIALLVSQVFFSTIIYKNIVGAGEVIKRVMSLTIAQTLLAYVILRVIGFRLDIGLLQFIGGTVFFVTLLIIRLCERWFIKLYRQAGRNYRCVTFVGSDPELISLYLKMKQDPALGYNVLGYYADEELGDWTHAIEGHAPKMEMPEEKSHQLEKLREPIKKLGTLQEFISGLNHTDDLVLGDDLYVCLSRRDQNIIRRISQMCDRKVIHFYYVPVSVESLGLNLKREFMDDLEIYTTYENPLQNPFNKAVKRLFDIVFSLIFLIPTALLFPFIFIIMKIQSPGPILFKQKRTGLDGKTFEMLKFRSMHVNADADKVQATKDDPRKYPFGNFMRKSNIDELPQFINVLKGDMSIVGPRPHMLAHTEQYSGLIDKYMVRHFVKPGVTGWAQVTGFRGETKELWQMEGRVKRDIWYIENWSFWLDLRIIWLTVKTIFIHDKNAY